MKLLTRKQYYEYIRNLKVNECLFCNYKKYQIVIAESEYWVWIFSRSPYWKWHTMFIPKRHLFSIDKITQKEFLDLAVLKKNAEKRYRKVVKEWEDGEPLSMFFYFWREREGGYDTTHKVQKQEHLHLHMAPERDGTMEKIVDPNATSFDYKKLILKTRLKSIPTG